MKMLKFYLDYTYGPESELFVLLKQGDSPTIVVTFSLN